MYISPIGNYEIIESLILSGFAELAYEYDEIFSKSRELSEIQKEQLEIQMTELRSMNADAIIDEFDLETIRSIGDFAYRYQLTKKLIHIVEAKGGGFWLNGNAPSLWYGIMKSPEPFIDIDVYTMLEDKASVRMEVHPE